MKITYPECQLEITAEELITVIDHFTTKATHHHEPTFEPGGIVGTGDDIPEPKPYPNMLDNEAIIPRGSGFQDLIKKGLEDAEAQGKLPEVQISTEEAPAESTKKATNKKKKVEIKLDNGEWRTFNSIARAAKYLDMSMTGLSNALIRGNKARGHEVRYATDNNEPTQPTNEEQTELP